MRKILIGSSVYLGLGMRLPERSQWTEDYNRLLAKYVVRNGVKYAAWHDNAQDRATLETVVDAIAKEKPDGDKDSKLAFYINAYNANILQGVLEKYPVKSVRDIAPLFGFFTQNRITVSGEKMSFNHLEKEIIHGFGEPRMHFVLNCASASCPPLLDKGVYRRKSPRRDGPGSDCLSRRQRTGGRGSAKTARRPMFRKFFEWSCW